jgi:hypothetical protein
VADGGTKWALGLGAQLGGCGGRNCFILNEILWGERVADGLEIGLGRLGRGVGWQGSANGFIINPIRFRGGGGAGVEVGFSFGSRRPGSRWQFESPTGAAGRRGKCFDGMARLRWADESRGGVSIADSE